MPRVLTSSVRLFGRDITGFKNARLKVTNQEIRWIPLYAAAFTRPKILPKVKQPFLTHETSSGITREEKFMRKYLAGSECAWSALRAALKLGLASLLGNLCASKQTIFPLLLRKVARWKGKKIHWDIEAHSVTTPNLVYCSLKVAHPA